MALLQRQCEKNSTSSSLSPQNDFYSKSFVESIPHLNSDISICLQKSEELCGAISSFARQYKNHESEIKKLQELLKNKKKKPGFKKNQEFPILQHSISPQLPYSFVPTVIFR